MSFLFGNRSNKTFKPKKNIPEGTHQYDLMKHAAATLGSGDLRLAVMLPEGEDLNEWVAVNNFFNQINMLYGTITEFCTEESCPLMSAGPKYEYHWADGTTVKKPIKCSAPKYIDYLMTWVQDQLDDENIFPSKIGVPFPKNFISIAKTILKRLFRVYAHIYHQHFSQVVQLDEEAHLNTSFKHFIFFVQEFNLIDKRELAPLSELIEKLIEKREGSNSTNTSSSNANHHSQQQQQTQHHHPRTYMENATSAQYNHYPKGSDQSYQSLAYQPQQGPAAAAATSPPYQSRIQGNQSPPTTSATTGQYPHYSPQTKPVPSHPPPHYSVRQPEQSQPASAYHGLPNMFHQPLPPKPPQAQQYYNIGANVSAVAAAVAEQRPPPPPPAYHQHLQQQTAYRNLNINSAGSGGTR